MRFELHHGDCEQVLATLPPASVDAIVTDPPYGIGFKANAWDKTVPSSSIWAQALRVLKPGGHLLSFFSARTYHRGALAIEEGGFEVRDQMLWLYGCGYPKHRSVLKPAHEPIVVARRPLEGTQQANEARWGTGGLRVQDNRVGEGARWPANLTHDGSPPVLLQLGDAARYFYSAKASSRDRDEGLEFRPTVDVGVLPKSARMGRNTHPTVKPTDLMRHLCRLVTPAGGVVLDPFMGSGSTGKAAMLEGLSFVGIEMDGDYVQIADGRIRHAVRTRRGHVADTQ